MRKAQTISIYKDGSDTIAVNNKTGAYTLDDTLDGLLTTLINAISPAGTPTSIELEEGDFHLAAPFTAIDADRVPGNIKIKGQGPGITNILLDAGCVSGFTIEGAVATAEPLTANAVEAEYTVTLSTADAALFAVGDYVLLRSDRTWISGNTSGVARQGEIHRIRSIDGGTGVITFYEVLMDTYNTADSSGLGKISMLQNIILEDLKIAPVPTGYTGQTGPLLRCKWVDNLQLKNVEVSDNTIASANNIILLNCINTKADIITRQTGNYPFVELPTTGQYGIYVGLACQHISVNIKSTGQWRHSVTTGGINTAIANAGIVRDLVISGSAEGGYSSAFDTHADTEGVVFQNCNLTSIGSISDDGVHNTGLITSRAKDVTITGCNMRMISGIGIRLSENSNNTVISGNTFHNIKKHSNSVNGIGVYLSNNIAGCVISCNSFYDNDNLNFGAIFGADNNHDTVISGNVFINCGPCRFTDSNDVIVSGNRFNNNTRRALYLLGTCDWWIIIGNNARNSVASTIVGSNHVFANNLNL